MNLLTAGRSLSADGPGFGSARVMATCMAMGQGAGTAAALCVRHGWSIGEVDTSLLHTTLTRPGRDRRSRPAGRRLTSHH